MVLATRFAAMLEEFVCKQLNQGIPKKIENSSWSNDVSSVVSSELEGLRILDERESSEIDAGILYFSRVIFLFKAFSPVMFL